MSQFEMYVLPRYDNMNNKNKQNALYFSVNHKNRDDHF